MKRTFSIYILTCLALLLYGVMPVCAQEAFYIYRNDGDFDGFFFDEVQRMGVSKFDLDSVEHDTYVVQDIVTADSTYRIPLAAIDSVGFQQPDIIYNPDVRHMDELGMTDYVTQQIGLTLTFAPSLPAAMRPRVGDVLLGFTGVLADGFGGRVTSVSNSAEGLRVECEYLTKMSDIFRQFITVEQIGTDEAGNTRHRIAGMNRVRHLQDGDYFSANLIDINASLKPTLAVDEHFSVSMSLNLGLKVRLVVSYNIRGDDYFIRTNLSEDWSVNAGMGMKLSGKNEYFYNFPGVSDELAAIKFPATCPLFEVKPFPKYGFRYEGTIEANVNFPSKSGGMVQSFTIDSDKGMGYSNRKKDGGQSSTNFIDDTSAELKFTGYVQAGLKFNFGVSTNSWFSKIFLAEIGVEVVAGPKIEGSVDLRSEVYQTGIYALRNSNFKIIPGSVDYEAKARLGYLWEEEKKFTFAEGNFILGPYWSLYFLPEFASVSATYNKDSHSVTTTWTTDGRRVFWPSTVGSVLSVNQMGLDPQRTADYGTLSFNQNSPARFTTNFPLWEKAIGPVYVMPIVKALGREDPVYTLAQKVMVPLYLKVKETNVSIPATGGKVVIPAETNGILSGDTIALPATNSFTTTTYQHPVTASYPTYEPITEMVTVKQAGRSDMYDRIELWVEGVDYPLFCTINNDGDLNGMLPCSINAGETTISLSGTWSSAESVKPGHWLQMWQENSGGEPTPVPIQEKIEGYFNIFMEIDRENSTDDHIVYKVTGGNVHGYAEGTGSMYGVVGFHWEEYIEDGVPYQRQVLDYGTITNKITETCDFTIHEGSFDPSDGSGSARGSSSHKRTSYNNTDDYGTQENSYTNDDEEMSFRLVLK
ncbi:MAG: hypothetical protein IJS89_05150 [Bacteroidaceae bacterium]|nr:hypothetical protein [Bacteroidaceae bacterium]